jgi:hypothetical protein
LGIDFSRLIPSRDELVCGAVRDWNGGFARPRAVTRIFIGPIGPGGFRSSFG